MSALLWLNPRVAVSSWNLGEVELFVALWGMIVEVAGRMRNLLRDDLDDVLVVAGAELWPGGLKRRMR